MTTSPGARRVPLQQRSRERLERILDAASHLFVERGYEATTMENIAERAQTSIGSVYQFFPNKRALFEAMGERYLERARALFDEVYEGFNAIDRWDTMLNRAIDTFDAFHRSHVVIRAVWLNWMQSTEFILAGEALNREFAARAEGLLAARAPNLAPEQRLLIATMIIEHISAMMVVSMRRGDDAFGRALLQETKIVLRRYLRPYLGAPRK